MEPETEQIEEKPGQNSEALDNPNGYRATYSPEDNKLRLYVGRVPREEYLKLRAEGWKALHKQREAGGGDFVATWTPERRNTALEYAGIIEDEDMGPEERAADRAERFAGYREKRTAEAVGHADTYDAGPSAHGFQSAARAERAARRHDRQAGRAVDAWDKAEYWQRRTAGVISHALYKSSPSVRMGRIKTIESELRRHQKSLEKWCKEYAAWKACAAEADPEKQTKMAQLLADYQYIPGDFTHPRSGKVASLSTLLKPYKEEESPITGAEAAALFLARYKEPQAEDDFTRHCQLRLAYENQMIEAQGGRAAHVEMIPGGFIGGRQIHKVNKSPATGRVVSVQVMGTHTGFTRESGYKEQKTVPCLVSIETERLPADAYRAPTAEELAKFDAEQKANKAKRKESAPPTIPLINPTDADAEKLQAIWNARAKAHHDSRPNAKYTTFEPGKVIRLTQERYSAVSKGAHARAETRELCADAEMKSRFSGMYYSDRDKHDARIGPAVCKLRTSGWSLCNVIVITDKPQKPLPAAVWTKLQPEAPAFKLEAETVNA